MKTFEDPLPDAKEVLDDIGSLKIERFRGLYRTDRKPDLRPCSHKGSMVHDPISHTFSCGDCGAPLDNYAVALRLMEGVERVKYRIERVVGIYERDNAAKNRIRLTAKQKRCKHTLKHRLPGSGYWYCPSCELTFGDDNDQHTNTTDERTMVQSRRRSD